MVDVWWKLVTVYCENHMKCTNTLYGQNAVFSVVPNGTYSDH